jgi:hypothetical protein
LGLTVGQLEVMNPNDFRAIASVRRTAAAAERYRLSSVVDYLLGL